jgi:PAS domain S-box-containing protein
MDKPTSAPSLDLERSAKEKFVLDQIGQILTSDFDLELLLVSIHRQLTELFEVDNFYVALLAPQRNEIWYPLAVKNGIRQYWSIRPLADRLTDRVILSGKAILLPHHAGEHIKQIGLQSSDETPHAWIGVPLIASAQTIGCLALFSSSPQFEFTEADLYLLNCLSDQTSTAIQVALRNAPLTSDLSFGRDRLELVLNSVEVGIALIERDGRITLANQALETITSYPQTEFLGKLIGELPVAILNFLGFTASEAADITRSLVDKEHQPIEKTIIKLGDQAHDIFLERAIQPVISTSDQDKGWLLLLRDVSEDKQAIINRDLISETLIHDLRSPISTVLSAVDMVEDATDGIDPTGIVKPSLLIARRSALRVLGMIESMLEIARFQAGKIELHLSRCDLRDLCEQILAEFSRQAIEYRIMLVNDIPRDLPQLLVDQAKIIRVITNLVDNAIKFTPAQGSVEIHAEIDANQDIEVWIKDTGPGIPMEYLEKIFDRFSQIPSMQGRKRGSGLGLTYCRMAVEAHGGRIWADSHEGEGSTFRFTLPIDRSIP